MSDNQGVMGGYIDRRDNSVITVSDKAFLNQIEQCMASADAFDKAFPKEMNQINGLANEVLLLLVYVHKHIAEISEIHKTIFGILSNALNTYLGCILLVRSGMAIQEGILFRSLLESISTAVFLFFNEEKYDDFKSGVIKSHDTISAAKRLFPMYGKVYGDLTQNYAHIGKHHYEHLPIFKYHEYPEDSGYVFYHAKNILWLLYVVAELVFYDASQRRYYWKRIGKCDYEFNPYPKELDAWRKQFMGDIPEELKNETIRKE